jgi:nucleoporin SEH1
MYKMILKELALEAQLQPIHDLAWAPAMGRSYHLIACASREMSFHIHTLRREEGGLVHQSSVRIPSPSEVWRVAWNSTGTVLATSAEDGTLSLWRRNFSEEWVNVQNLPLVGSSKAVYSNSS